jgi:phosphatidate cytidylyltransferase
MRLLFGWLLFFTAVGSIVFGGLIFPLVLGFAAFLGGEEYIMMMRAKGMKPSPRIIRGMIIAFFVVSALPKIPGLQWLPWNFSLEHFPILLTVGVCISFFRLLLRAETPPATIADIATTILGFIYLGWMPSHLVLLRNLSPPGFPPATSQFQEPGLAYVWVILFIVWSTDVFAYYFGTRFGKTLLYPQVSPRKTVEGAIGGFVASIILAILIVYLADNYFFPAHPFRFKLWQAPLMGAVLSIAAQLGDLCESLLKRDAGLKDSSTLIPGHGGILDRGDSLLFTGAIGYYWVCLVVLGIL